MSNGTKVRRWASLGQWSSILLLIAVGCSASGPAQKSVTDTCHGTSNTGPDGSYSCTENTSQSQDGIAPSDFTAAASSSSVLAFRLILNLPSDAVINTQSPVQATLSGTTDKGYTSSITVTLQPTTSTTQPIAPGDTVYTFLLPNSSEVTSWASTVAANANSSINVSSSIVAGLNLLGNAGSYVVTIQEVTGQTGLTTVGSVGVTDPGPSAGCPPCPPNKPCTVCGPQN